MPGGASVGSSGNVTDLIVPRKRASGLLTTGATVVAVPAGTKAVKIWASTLTKVGAGASASATSPTQEAQTITKGDATSGNFTAAFQGQTSGNIAWNTSAASVVTALVAMTSIGAAGVTATGGVLSSSPVVVTFAAGILDGDQPLLVLATVDLAGGVSAGSRLPTVAETTPAVTTAGYVEANTEQYFNLAASDAYLYLVAAAGTGTYRVSFFS